MVEWEDAELEGVEQMRQNLLTRHIVSQILFINSLSFRLFVPFYFFYSFILNIFLLVSFLMIRITVLELSLQIFTI